MTARGGGGGQQLYPVHTWRLNFVWTTFCSADLWLYFAFPRDKDVCSWLCRSNRDVVCYICVNFHSTPPYCESYWYLSRRYAYVKYVILANWRHWPRQRCFNVGSAGRWWTSIGSIPHVCWEVGLWYYNERCYVILWSKNNYFVAANYYYAPVRYKTYIMHTSPRPWNIHNFLE